MQTRIADLPVAVVSLYILHRCLFYFLMGQSDSERRRHLTSGNEENQVQAGMALLYSSGFHHNLSFPTASS